ncbi:uncharacterized protein LOC105357979 isoform X2 [Oryzias latipes]
MPLNSGKKTPSVETFSRRRIFGVSHFREAPSTCWMEKLVIELITHYQLLLPDGDVHALVFNESGVLVWPQQQQQLRARSSQQEAGSSKQQATADFLASISKCQGLFKESVVQRS